VVIHFIGRFIVAIVTSGKVGCEYYDRGSTSWRSHRRIYGWWGFYRRQGHQIFLSASFTTVIGLRPFICFFVWLYFAHGSTA
jgi:hypothetical protein